MDKKWWAAEARLCESHGLRTLAQKARDIGEGKVEVKSREQRARDYLASVEARVRHTPVLHKVTHYIISCSPIERDVGDFPYTPPTTKE
jgi:hypothetical protein